MVVGFLICCRSRTLIWIILSHFLLLLIFLFLFFLFFFLFIISRVRAIRRLWFVRIKVKHARSRSAWVKIHLESFELSIAPRWGPYKGVISLTLSILLSLQSKFLGVLSFIPFTPLLGLNFLRKEDFRGKGTDWERKEWRGSDHFEARWWCRSDFTHIHEYLCRLSFLTTLDIYKDYFKGRHIGCNLMQRDHTCILWSETIFPSSSHSL